MGNQLKLFRQAATAGYEGHTEHFNALRWQIVEIVMLKMAVRILTTKI
jgi:hypothetical protein